MRAEQGFSLLKHIILTFAAVSIIAPISMVVFATFKNTPELFNSPLGLPKSWDFANYTSLFAAENMLVYFINSLVVTSISVFAILVLGSMVAYSITRLPRPFGSLLFAFFTLGMMVPVQVNMIPTYLEMAHLNLLDSHFGLILVTVATLLPICIFILTAFMKTIPNELIEAADMDGASHWQIYCKIVLPLSVPSIITAAIFCIVITWNDLLYPLLFLKTPGLKTLPVALLQFQGEYLTNYPLIFAGVIVASVPMILLYILLQHYFIAGTTAGSIKG